VTADHFLLLFLVAFLVVLHVFLAWDVLTNRAAGQARRGASNVAPAVVTHSGSAVNLYERGQPGARQNRRYRMATFYRHTDPAPADPPPFVVETVRGGWGFDTLGAAQEFVSQMRANGRAARLLVKQ